MNGTATRREMLFTKSFPRSRESESGNTSVEHRDQSEIRPATYCKRELQATSEDGAQSARFGPVRLLLDVGHLSTAEEGKGISSRENSVVGSGSFARQSSRRFAARVAV
jgi:hypothetical protein